MPIDFSYHQSTVDGLQDSFFRTKLEEGCEDRIRLEDEEIVQLVV